MTLILFHSCATWWTEIVFFINRIDKINSGLPTMKTMESVKTFYPAYNQLDNIILALQRIVCRIRLFLNSKYLQCSFPASCSVNVFNICLKHVQRWCERGAALVKVLPLLSMKALRFYCWPIKAVTLLKHKMSSMARRVHWPTMNYKMTGSAVYNFQWTL